MSVADKYFMSNLIHDIKDEDNSNYISIKETLPNNVPDPSITSSLLDKSNISLEEINNARSSRIHIKTKASPAQSPLSSNR